VKRARVPAMPSRRTVRAVYILPDPNQPGLLERDRIALRIRNDATISGTCACGATSGPVRYRAGETRMLEMEHEPGCPATSNAIEQLVDRIGPTKLLYLPIVVDLEVAA
jgi:hypothetical protein